MKPRTTTEIIALLNGVYGELLKEPYVSWPTDGLRRECRRDTGCIHVGTPPVAEGAYKITTPFFELKISANHAKASKRKGNIDYSDNPEYFIENREDGNPRQAEDIVKFLVENDMWCPTERT